MPEKEATARIKINKLLEAAGWRFFQEGNMPANIRLEPSVTIKSTDLDALGDNFEKTTKGFVDFLLLDAKGFPLIVLRGQGRGQESARRQRAGSQVRPFTELPLRHPLQREPALFLGSRTRQPLRHHLVSDTGLSHRLPEGHAQSGAPDRRPSGRGLHRSHPAPELPIGGRVAERSGAPLIHPGQQAALSPALSAQGHPQPSGRSRRRQGPLPVRDGHRYRKDTDRRRRHQAVSPFRQRTARPVPRGSP